MHIATQDEANARATHINTRNVNPAHLHAGDKIVGETGRITVVKTVDHYAEVRAIFGPRACTPLYVHINRTLCHDTRVDVRVIR